MQEPLIRVGIMSATNISFVLHGSFKTSSGELFSGAQSVEIQSGMILFNSRTITELIFEPVSEECSFELKDVIIGINFHWERKENQRFQGSLKLIVEQVDSQEMITAINLIPVESYLKSVISSEMSATASIELLKAHAVISRSWLLSCHLNPPVSNAPTFSLSKDEQDPTVTRYIKWYERDAHANFDVCADDHCQRYQGITRATTDKVNEAIEATRAEVLMYQDKICDARYSKSCGGVSETFDTCWAAVHHPYLSMIVDHDTDPKGYILDLTSEENAEKWIRESPAAFCNTTDKQVLSQVLNNYDQETTDFYRWKIEYTQAQLAELIARRSGMDFGSIIDLVPLKRGASGRLSELKIIGTKQTVIVGKELEIRKWLSESHLYSSAFVVDKTDISAGIPGKFVLTGSGWGHGVGLCQIGAAVMGEKGYSYDRILKHYFLGSELKRIY
jgi:SpoIID/LytB domain protein